MASDPDLDTARKKRQFLAGGGQMGAAIRAFDWSSTSLGDPACWPDSLRVVVRAMLTTNHPIFIFWGLEHICLYNDAYSASLGPEKHPSILGGPGRVAFDEIWHIIGPQIDLVMAGKGATWHVDHLVPSYRHGKLDEVYWTYSYSPIDDEAADNSVGGVLVICKETTGEVLARRERDELDRRLKMALSAGGGIGTWDWDVPANRVTADRNFATLYGVDPAFAAKGAPIETFFSGVHPLDLPRLQKAIEKAMSDGSLFREDYRLVQPDGSLRWVSAQGRCMLDDEGRCIRFPGVSFDITDRRKTQEELEIITADRELIIELAREQRALSDPDEIMRAAASRLGLRLGVDRAAHGDGLDARHLASLRRRHPRFAVRRDLHDRPAGRPPDRRQRRCVRPARFSPQRHVPLRAGCHLRADRPRRHLDRRHVRWQPDRARVVAGGDLPGRGGRGHDDRRGRARGGDDPAVASRD